MKGLFIKDILLLKGQGRTIPVIVGCGILLSVAMQQSTAIVYLGIIISMLTLSTVSGLGIIFINASPNSHKEPA